MVPKGWVLLGALATFAAGIGVGLLIAGRDAAPARTVVREAERPPPPSRADPATARALFESAPLPPLPEGDGRIEGRVLTASGAPLAGASIHGACTAPRPGDGAWPEDPVEQLDRFARDLRWSDALRRTAVTGEDGAFVLDRLPDAPYALSARKPGWRIRAKGAGEVRPGATVEFTAEPAIVVRARLVLPADAGDARPTVEASAGSTSRRYSASAGVAEFELPPGDWTLRATAGEFSEYASEPVPVKIVEGAGSVEVTLALAGRSGVRGRILLDWAAPLGHVEVRAVALGPDGTPEGVSFSESARRTSLRPRAGGYAYAFLDLAPGRYALGVLLSLYDDAERPAAVEVVQLDAGLVTRDIVVPPPPRSEYAVVHAAGPDGEAVPDLQIATSIRSPRRSSSGGGAAFRRPDGAYLVFHRSDSGADPSETEWSIEVRAAQLGERTIRYRRGPADEFHVRFTRSGTLVVTLKGFTGAGYQANLGLVLRAPLGDEERKAKSRSFHAWPSRPDAKGSCTFGPCQTGPQELLVTHGERPGVVLAVHAVAIEPGEHHVEIPVPVAHPLRVRTGRAGARVQLQPADPESEWFLASAASDAGGVASFPALPPGRYTLRLDAREAVVEVRGPTETALDG